PLLLQALDFADTTRFMEELYRRSVDAWHDHVEFEGHLQPGQNGERGGYLSLKLYPRGKAQSDESMTAETWVGFSNKPKEEHLHFDFKLSKQPKTPFSPEEYL
ncbi:MAG: hypothetical protein ACREJU_17060, partial [Nitrospiraceae bacterium]